MHTFFFFFLYLCRSRFRFETQTAITENVQHVIPSPDLNFELEPQTLESTSKKREVSTSETYFPIQPRKPEKLSIPSNTFMRDYS